MHTREMTLLHSNPLSLLPQITAFKWIAQAHLIQISKLCSFELSLTF